MLSIEYSKRCMEYLEHIRELRWEGKLTNDQLNKFNRLVTSSENLEEVTQAYYKLLKELE